MFVSTSYTCILVFVNKIRSLAFDWYLADEIIYMINFIRWRPIRKQKTENKTNDCFFKDRPFKFQQVYHKRVRKCDLYYVELYNSIYYLFYTS